MALKVCSWSFSISSRHWRNLFLHHCTSSRRDTTIRCRSTDSSATTNTNRKRRSSSTTPASTSDKYAVRAVRLGKVKELRDKGLEPFAYKWDRTHSAADLHTIYDHLQPGEESNADSNDVSVSGRIMARRAFGKLAFLTLRDASGAIQLYCEKERLSNDHFEQLKSLVDVGDIVGASGSIKRTEKGELSVQVSSFLILTKSLLPLPDKYHGLTDIDMRQRQRYVDMIANPEVVDAFRKRAKIISELRKTVESYGFIEVETPILQADKYFHMYNNNIDPALFRYSRIWGSGWEQSCYEITGGCARNTQ